MSTKILTDEEAQAIIMSLAESRGDEGFDERDAEVAVAWANSVIVSYKLFELVKKGLVAINVKNGDTVFSRTSKGNKLLGKSSSKIDTFLQNLSDNMKGKE